MAVLRRAVQDIQSVNKAGLEWSKHTAVLKSNTDSNLRTRPVSSLRPLPNPHPSRWAGDRLFGRSTSAGREPESAPTRCAELHVSVPDTSEPGPRVQPPPSGPARRSSPRVTPRTHPWSPLGSKSYGNVLVLDGVIQCTERDEFSYQEMIANLPLCSHPNPRKVLIIGGGDGGVLREVVKHSSVEAVVQCEIDEDVIQVSKKFLPSMAVGYSSSKLTLHVGDGFEFMKQNQDAFDVIITDSSDPMGPAESLFKESYYQLMKTALKEDGILCCQGECQWLHLDLIK
ncbi:PREDICTED: spermidine synthase, partial [Bison bison bison]|uniref:Spermidine synthase n=1 Tax=Bison bison bison TaxID=43346 RepID=A0A6P3I9P9_BISBB